MDEAFRPGQAVEARPRLTEACFPSYSYVPGLRAHPVTDAAAHTVGAVPGVPPPLCPKRWSENRTYLYAIDLFNHGYYWEAHEAWESLWHAAGRRGRTADWLKGLIKLTATAVKLREGNAVGVRRHARRASELLRSVCPNGGRFAGLESAPIVDFLERLSVTSAPLVADPDKLLPVVLMPALETG
ncbi:DUF309 domain-containing protein [Botrimarina sp.]|uniref:DUF309 domain-containing protein n=1 Tax=Botrimarina sp. TaxID=2795802 RepID=UPI0032EE57C5